MCGIWAYVCQAEAEPHISNDWEEELYASFQKIKHRGPDRSSFLTLHGTPNTYLGFHRLAITDLSSAGDQPFMVELPNNQGTVYFLINGEIYNHESLRTEMAHVGLYSKSNSDCEIVLVLFQFYCLSMEPHKAFKNTISRLQGEWACLASWVQKDATIIMAARDVSGVRPLFFSHNGNSASFSSELKGLVEGTGIPLPPNCILTVTVKPTLQYPLLQFDSDRCNSLFDNSVDGKFHTADLLTIREKIFQAVEKRLNMERPCGFLLSGGIDSSLVAAIAAKHCANKNPKTKIRTFCIGMPNSPDVYFAQKVADFIGSDHTVVPFDTEKALKMIPTIVNTIESWDVTTVRASTPHYILLEWISKNTDIKVIFTGEYMDEVAGSYLYLHNAPNTDAFHKECIRLVQDIYLFDSLRADRCIAAHGIEARVPFSDEDFIREYLTIYPEQRKPRSSKIMKTNEKVEKALIREAFWGLNLLPEEIILRTKNAFSDAVSHESKSWYQYLEEEARNLGFETELDWYRSLFVEAYGMKHMTIIPYQWLPKWSGNVTNPSARVLPVYQTAIQEREKHVSNTNSNVSTAFAAISSSVSESQ
jgi:asparagine synthase (glutamine-hydrolysing)